MSTQSPAGPAEAAADLICQAIKEDGRDQKVIAAEAGMSPAHLTRLRTPYADGGRNLTSRQARKLGRIWPHRADELSRLAADIEDAATLPAAEDDSASPGYRNVLTLSRLFTRTADTIRTPSLLAA